MTIASPPPFLMLAATASQASALRLDIATFAPNEAMISAAARPMPLLDPVIMATCPERSNGVVMGSKTSLAAVWTCCQGRAPRLGSAIIVPQAGAQQQGSEI